MATINRGYPELPANVNPDVPHYVNLALRRIDTDVELLDMRNRAEATNLRQELAVVDARKVDATKELVNATKSLAASTVKLDAVSDDAKAARTAAAAAAVSAEAAKNGALANDEGTAYFLESGAATAAAAAKVISAAVAPKLAALRGAAVPDVRAGYLFVTDSATGRRRQATTGTQVLNDDPVTLGEGVAVTVDGARRWVSPSGYPRPVSTDFSKASGWGSSTMQRLGPDLTAMFAKYNTAYNHTTGSVGSFQISHIAAAVGVRPMTVGAFTIPAAATAAPIVPTNMPEANNTAIVVWWSGKFAGTDVAGVVQTAANSATWTFTRTTAGAAVDVPAGAAFIPDRAQDYQAGVTILNPGKNTLTSPKGEWNVDRVIELTDEMYDYFAGAGRHVLVLGHFVDTNKAADTYERATIRKYNEHMRARYGGRFVDIGAYLTGSQVWTDTGITPTDADRAQQALGNKPPSLSDDNLHLNQKTDEAITRLLEAKLAALGWLNIAPAAPPAPPKPLTVIGDDFNRADSIDLGRTSVGGVLWRPVTGTTVAPEIVGKKMVNTTPWLRRAVVAAPSGAQDYEISARIAGLGTVPADKNMALLLRAVDADNLVYLAVRQHTAAEGAAFWLRAAGTPYLLGEANAAVKSAVGQVWKAKIVGQTLTAYVDGEQVLSVTDSRITTGADAGLQLGGDTSVACAWDDFEITKI